MLAADVVISEFLAVNDNGLRNDAGDRSDWIELFNAGDETVNLDGYFLTDDAADLNKWRFPAVDLVAGEYLIVSASGESRTDPALPLHAGFRLSGGGEYLALVEPDGRTVAFEFGPQYPSQIADVSFGLPRPFQPETLLESGAAATALVPAVENGGDLLGTAWTEMGFDDTAWMSGTTGIGYERTSGFDNLIGLDVEDQMYLASSSIFIRVPFSVADTSDLVGLTLQMKYDDGFVAYLNGQMVASRNAPEVPLWDSGASSSNPDNQAILFEDIDITEWLDALNQGDNVLAIQGLNAGNSGSDFLILPELAANRSQPLQADAHEFFLTPTPGQANDVGFQHVVTEVGHGPRVPREDQDLTVTATVSSSNSSDVALSLRYVVMRGRRETKLPMFDDGQHGDLLAGDGIYAATIPASAYSAGEMVRFYVTATESASNAETRWPAFNDPLNSREYYGTIVEDPAVVSNLPVMHLFISDINAANSDAGTRASLFFDGELYDNIQIDIHGQSTRGGNFPRKSYDVDFNRDHRFRFSDDLRRMKDFNLLTNWADKTRVRNTLAYETYRDADATHHLAEPIRLQVNGEFYAIYDFVEDGDDRFIERLGLDPDGALYKMYNRLDSSAPGSNSAEKKTRLDEDHSDLQALIAGLNLAAGTRERFIYDNINIPAMVNFSAAMVITGNVDCCHKNYYAYRDTNGNGEWEYLPWDVDLSFGHNWTSQFTYFDNRLFVQNGLFTSNGNRLLDALFQIPEYRNMYLRRVRSLMDELLQPSGRPTEALKYEARIAELVDQLAPDVALDFARWGSWGTEPTWEEQIDILLEQYLPQRRQFLYNMAQIPAAQMNDAALQFGTIEFAADDRDQDEEFIEFRNPDDANAVDVSGWRVTGAVEHTFKSGTVIPAGGSLYLSPDVSAFRSRVVRRGPKGGQGLFIQGDYVGHLPRAGGELRIVDKTDREVAAIVLEGDPTPAQEQLRITEIMYHPADPPAGSAFDDNDFEYVELTNTGAAPLDLTGVRFADGIQFDFTSAAVNMLEPGGHVLVVSNLAAFESRYGGGLNVAGEYSGQLSNGGEQIVLVDGLGGDVLNFAYDDAWYPSTDGDGHSLVIVDPRAGVTAWGQPSGWRASTSPGGSPGQEDVDRIPGDTNGDGVVDGSDLDSVRNNFSLAGEGVPGDANGDGVVNLDDLNEVRNNFGAGAPAAGFQTAPVSQRIVERRSLLRRSSRGHIANSVQNEVWKELFPRIGDE